METMPLTHGRNAREKPGNGTTLAKRKGSPRRSERRSLSISCCILSRWPMATGQALPVLRHLECAVQCYSSLLLPPAFGLSRAETFNRNLYTVTAREGVPLGAARALQARP